MGQEEGVGWRGGEGVGGGWAGRWGVAGGTCDTMQSEEFLIALQWHRSRQ